MPTVRRGWSCLLVVLAVGLAVPAVSSAHFGSTRPVAIDFEARVVGFRPAMPGVGARVLAGDQRLELRVGPPRVVVVLGLLGEPFLRFSPNGVEANLASPTASSARVVEATDAVASERPRWRRVSIAHVFAWHESRLRPVSTVEDASTDLQVVGTWSIPLLVGGRPASLVGNERYAGAPVMWPWLAAGVLMIALAGVAARFLPARLRGRTASAFVTVSILACLAAWFGTRSAGHVMLVGGIAIVLLGMRACTSGEARLGTMALFGVFAAASALPQVRIFEHGIVLSALPATAARLTVATALISGLAAATLCIPSVITLSEGYREDVSRWWAQRFPMLRSRRR
jgi:hypothetical protein